MKDTNTRACVGIATEATVIEICWRHEAYYCVVPL